MLKELDNSEVSFVSLGVQGSHRSKARKFKKTRTVNVCGFLLLLGFSLFHLWPWVSQTSVTPVLQEFEEFLHKSNKYYSTEEKAQRLEIFSQNLNFINLHNSQNLSFKLAVNFFSDLTLHETQAHFTGYRKSKALQSDSSRIDWRLLDVENLPDSIDWRDRGCVSAPTDQKRCGSCWAFSAAGAVEGSYCAKYGQLKTLSKQQLVDCGRIDVNRGCRGGEMDEAFEYIINNGGLCTEQNYPYIARDAHCLEHECKPIARVDGFKEVPRESERALMAAIVLHGPVSVAIQADEIPFQFYSSGVFDSSCGSRLNHGVLVVGYGTDKESELPYWTVKNSWGPHWGEGGYIKISRGGSRGGKCGILLDSSFPIIH